MHDEYTLKEAAEALGITKNTVKYRLKKVPESMVRRGSDGIIYVTSNALELIRRTTDKPVNHETKTNETVVDKVVCPGLAPYDKPVEPPVQTGSPAPTTIESLANTIEVLRAQLEAKDKQLAEKDIQIGKLLESILMAQEQAKAMQAQLVEAQQPHEEDTEQATADHPEQEKTPDTPPQSFWQRIWSAIKG